ncbi:hypothetical protein [Burkholderia stagnalis]|uniref:hypothetical protein n=1 Tax=Burkholderia stagnalis TaxID=1503054 RepID=UPI000F591297|nr:hypothetical protein [Burkholderia stagnalis]
MNMVIAGLLVVVIVLLLLLLGFFANLVIPFMDSCKHTMVRLAGDSETGRVGEIGRLREELAAIRVRLDSINDSRVMAALESIDDHLFVDVCRTIEDASPKDAVNQAARESTTEIAKELFELRHSLRQLDEIAKYLAEMSIREPR